MTNLRESDSGLSSHYHRIFLMVLRKPTKDLKKVIRNRRSCRHSYWAPTKQVPSIDVCSTPICSVYIVYTFTTTLHHPIYYTILLYRMFTSPTTYPCGTSIRITDTIQMTTICTANQNVVASSRRFHNKS
jgi:hypothetical protein